MTELQPLDLILPAVFGGVFIAIMSAVREPARQEFNAIFVAGAGTAYLNGGLGLWEFPYIVLATIPAYLGLRSYRFIGIAWLMHTGWDVVHHLNGTPIWPFAATSSAGCAVLDALIAVWFLAGAPSAWARWVPALAAQRA